MRPKRSKYLDSLTRKITNLDEKSIDELYGLEPVFQSDAATEERSEPTLFITVHCPYCAEQYETQVDLTAGTFTHIEDCHVCCQAIELHVEVDDRGRLRSTHAQRMD